MFGFLVYIKVSYYQLFSTDLRVSWSLQTHAVQPNLNSSGDSKVSKDTKYVRLNVREMSIK